MHHTTSPSSGLEGSIKNILRIPAGKKVQWPISFLCSDCLNQTANQSGLFHMSATDTTS